MLDRSLLESAFTESHGLPRLRVHKLWGHVSTHFGKESWHEVWTSVAIEWLGRLRRRLRKEYRVFESENFLYLTDRGQERAQRLAVHCEASREAILRDLDGIASSDGYGKLVCLIFSEPDLYYDYVSHYYHEGEFGASAGIFVGGGYGHFVLHGSDERRAIGIIPHELTHAYVRHLPIPLWLNEAMATTCERTILREEPFGLTIEAARRHHAFWREHPLNAFWFGWGFHGADEGQHLCYQLAQILLWNILPERRAQFAEFARKAHFSDAGESAAVELLGCRLPDLASRFLGPGDWSIQARTADDFLSRAARFAEHREHARSLDDLEAALRAEPGRLDARLRLASLRASCPNRLLRDPSQALEIATRACEATQWKHVQALEVLAAAHASSGDHAAAARWCRKALAFVDRAARARLEEALQRYSAGTHEDDGSTDPES